MELLSQLGINWMLLLAQVVNFVILAGILTAFVYKPLMATIDARAERIRKSMEEASRIENQGKEMDKLRVKQMAKMDEEAGAYLDQLRKEADALRATMIANAGKESEQMLARSRKQIADEREEMLRDATAKISSLVLLLSEKLLKREFSSADQTRLLSTIEKELPQLVA